MKKLFLLLFAVLCYVQASAYTLYYYHEGDYKYAVWYWGCDDNISKWSNWMTPVSGHDNWYTVDIPSDCENVIFVTFNQSVSTPDWDYMVSQTADLVCDGVNAYFYEGKGWQSGFGSSAIIITGTCGDNLTWSYNSSTGALTITGTGAMTNWLVQAEKVPWYSYRSEIKTVNLPEGLTSIAYEAFKGCTGLTSVTIPNSVTSIGVSAFDGCTGLTSVTIGNSVTSIVNSAFRDCTGLTSVTIPNSVTSIGSSAFGGCTGLTSVTIPNSVTSIGNYAFGYCTGLTSVTIPNSVTSIEFIAFSGCTGLTSIVVEQGNTKYDSRDNCNAIIETATNTLIAGCQNTVIPNSVTSIANCAFDGLTGLTSVVIGNGVKSIGSYAFSGCTGLQSITCYSMRPPTVIDQPFSALPYSTIVYVPADYQKTYMMHDIWGLYDVRPIGSTTVQTTDLMVTPHYTTADVAWPTVDNAATYELVITQNGTVVCTLVFNAQGQLTSIAFRAPAESARAAGQGFQFTVTGLEDGCAYSLTLNAKDAAGNVLRTFSKEFSTGYTAIEEVNADGVAMKPRKVLIDGAIYILMPDGRMFNLQGAEVK